jgi:hypothetical protein
VSELVAAAQKAAPSIAARGASGLLQRKCDCGNSTTAGGECAECGKQGLQRKLSIGATDDPLELEADRVADQVMAAPVHPVVNDTPLRIQRFSGHSNGQLELTPPSVDQVIGSPGLPMEPVLRQDMEQRFGHDFSRVRVHSGAAAEQSARTMKAHAYTVGRNIVFGSGQFASGTLEGRRLIAHELTHVLQQAHSVQQVQCKKQPTAHKTAIDASKLTDAEKAQLREKIRKESEEVTEAELKSLEGVPISEGDRKIVDGWRRELVEALKGIKAQHAGRQRDVETEDVETMLASLNDDLMVKLFLNAKGGGPPFNRQTLANMVKGAPVKEEQLEHWEGEATSYRSGAHELLWSANAAEKYRELGVTPEQLRTEEETETEAKQQKSGATQPAAPGQTAGAGQTQDPTTRPRTVEERLLLQDLYASLPEASDSTVGNEEELLKAFKAMSMQEREQFKQFLQTTNKPGADPKPLSEAITNFKLLSPVDREVIEVNKRLGEEDPAGKEKRLEGPVLLKMQNEAQKLAAPAQKLKNYRAAAIAQIHGKLRDPSQQGGSLPDLGVQLFVNEMAMAHGLMGGAADASPSLVAPVVDHLISELINARETILQGFAEDALTSLAWMALPYIGPEVSLVKAAAIIKKYYAKFEALAKVYRTAEKIEHIVELISGIGPAYQQFREIYKKGIATYESAQALLSDLNAPEELEERVEAEKDKLAAQFEELLEGKLGDLLEMMFIPATTSPEDLIKIIFNIPRGVEALQRMWDYYTSPEAKGDGAEAILMIRGFEAGTLLYPFVGLLVAELDKAFAAFIGHMTKATPLIDKLMPKSERTGGRERGRKIFRWRNRKRTKINDATLQPYLDEGATTLKQLIGDDERGGHWAPAWFRFSMRAKLGKLNRNFAGRKVQATVEQKSGKGADKAKTATTEQVPLPEFRLKFAHTGKRAKKTDAMLELNPKKKIEVDVMTNDDFNKGEKYDGTPEKRQEAIRDWLRDSGYQITHDKANKPHIRLPHGKTADRDHSYLRFVSGSIVKWNPESEKNDDYKNFLGQTITSSVDLPEGYLLPSAGDKSDDAIDSVVKRKSKLAKTGNLDPIGLDENEHLVPGLGKYKPPEKIWPPKYEAPKMEGYHWSSTVDTMQAAPRDYKDQGKDKDAWLKLIASDPGLNRRPTRWKGTLGYTVRARAGSDHLGSRYLPELKKADDKGHLVARRFESSDDYNNLIPMKTSLNRSPGAWFNLEQEMAKSYIGKQHQPNEYVKFVLDIDYPNPNTRRPNLFTMTWATMIAAKAQQPGDADKTLKSRSPEVYKND